jgi:hypothetical protein
MCGACAVMCRACAVTKVIRNNLDLRHIHVRRYRRKTLCSTVEFSHLADTRLSDSGLGHEHDVVCVLFVICWAVSP